MNKIKIFQVDAFAEKRFEGNPAAVCPLHKWLDDDIMQSIAAENNLAETAFIVPEKDYYEIRWFTPTVEVNLCGHATLASAFVIFNQLNYTGDTIKFHSLRSGQLKVSREGEILYLDFPTDTLSPNNDKTAVEKGIGILPEELYRGKTDYIAVLKSEEEVQNVQPVFSSIAKLDCRGLIVTAPGNKVDFVSRFFGPQSGINEDPVTGSAHTSLIPYWSKRFHKKEMKAKQISQRGGVLLCKQNQERVIIGGKAKLYLAGEIYI
ncbi:PhzF family phenazine biosynthesis isomerase [Flavobacteriaceae bacterium R38]|nr:PhzF family phenazine biosynthesis isomerase [Flavobacteriaceae bacterium R38]